ncbi:T9SS type A sorting domain-containing protein [Winogradskyella ursingii]|uniref:T9SS type A sorting domain-containing protein n=1 Tax=Winogradskyella ursingii TaxID=2686079 RepID=UPI0015CB6979|nr:lamin tail domain-containing protein [Winogradskyella ursingii]
MKQFYILALAVLVSSLGFGQTTIYTDEFTGENNKGQIGSTLDLSGVDWTLDTSAGSFTNNSDYFAVQGEQFEAQDVDGTVIFTSQTFSINGFSNLTFSFDAGASGDFEAGSDIYEVRVFIDGSSQLLFEGVVDEDITGDPMFFGTTQLSSVLQNFSSTVTGTGNNAFVQISVNNNVGTERYFFDNLEVTGSDDSLTPTITFDSATSTENETNATFNTSIPLTMTNYESDVTVSVSVNGSSTAEAEDYTLNTTSLSFTANETLNVSLDINEDADFDDETLILDIAVTSGTADLAISQHTITIEDNDVPVLIITEIMQNPDATDQVNGEYFEVYNPTDIDIDMNAWTISDFGTDSHVIGSSVIVPSLGFAVLGRNADEGVNGGVEVDYDYSGFQLNNEDDEVILTDNNGNLIDRVDYTGSSPWPNPTGAAMIYTGSDIEDNNDGSLWEESTTSEGIDSDFGSPGSNGTGQIVTYLAFKDGSWNTDPNDSNSNRNAIIQSGTYTLPTDVGFNDMFVDAGAAVVVPSGVTLATASVNLRSTSSQYSSLLSNDNVLGTVTYKRHVNQQGSDGVSGGNDLISLPLFPSVVETFDQFLTRGTPDNASKLASNSIPGLTTYGFGPYDNSSLSPRYINYTSQSTDALVQAKGYRAALTNADETLTFTGAISADDVTFTLTNPAVGNFWNLIGNPFPTYVDAQDWLEVNNVFLDENAVAIYAYNSGTYSGNEAETGNFTIINMASNNTLNIAPGQAFFIAAGEVNIVTGNPGTVIFGGNSGGFPDDMRTTVGTDDFIEGRTNTTNYNLKLALTGNSTHFTNFYFNSNSSLGLDPGYDAASFEAFGDSAFYSQLVEDNQDRAMAIQSLNENDLTDVRIPLGVNANQGEQLSFSIDFSDLPSDVNVYLEDNVANTITLLNTSAYTFTPSSAIEGTGRFFLRLANSVLSTQENSFDNLNIYTQQSTKTIIIEGLLSLETTANIYDIQGRLVASAVLSTDNTSQTINVENLNTGVYIVKLNNVEQTKSQKIILN